MELKEWLEVIFLTYVVNKNAHVAALEGQYTFYRGAEIVHAEILPLQYLRASILQLERPSWNMLFVSRILKSK